MTASPIEHDGSLLTLAEMDLRDYYRHLCVLAADMSRPDAETPPDAVQVKMLNALQKLLRQVEGAVARLLADQLLAIPGMRQETLQHLARADIDLVDHVRIRNHFPENVGLAEYLYCGVREHDAWRQAQAPHPPGASSRRPEALDGLVTHSDPAIAAAASGFLADEVAHSDLQDRVIVHHKELPRRIALPIYWWVAAELRRWLSQNVHMPLAYVDDAIERTVRLISAQPISDHENARILVDHLEAKSGLNDALLLNFMQHAHYGIAFVALARRLRADTIIARRIFFSSGSEVFAALCRVAALSREAYTELFALRRSILGQPRALSDVEIDALHTFYASLDDDLARSVIRCWSRDPSYVSAINFSETWNLRSSIQPQDRLPL